MIDTAESHEFPVTSRPVIKVIILLPAARVPDNAAPASGIPAARDDTILRA
jgi:hypothetical protein